MDILAKAEDTATFLVSDLMGAKSKTNSIALDIVLMDLLKKAVAIETTLKQINSGG